MDYTEKFEELVKEQLKRIEKLKNEPPATDFSKLDKIIIGFVDGDGIGPVIMRAARKVLDEILAEDVAQGRIEMRTIEGLTLENRAAKMETLPDDVLDQIKQCHALFEGSDDHSQRDDEYAESGERQRSSPPGTGSLR